MFDCGFTKENNWFRYRAAAIIVENGCVLLATNDKVDYFYSVGGGVQMGEKAEDAVVREVFEETGLKLQNYQKRGLASFCRMLSGFTC
jgi:8-oxo-dGTP pyrophosphatase MutT (NUDIX family)